MTPSDIPPGAWTAIGTIVVAFIGFVGLFVTRRQAEKASRVQREANSVDALVRSDQLRLQHYEGLVDRMDRRLQTVERRMGELEEKLAEERREREIMERSHRSLVSYLRAVLGWVRSKMPGENPPEPPADIADLVKNVEP